MHPLVLLCINQLSRKAPLFLGNLGVRRTVAIEMKYSVRHSVS